MKKEQYKPICAILIIFLIVAVIVVIRNTEFGKDLAGEAYRYTIQPLKKISISQETLKKPTTTITRTKKYLCSDSDNRADFLTKGTVNSLKYPSGKEDYCYTFPNGKTYLIEGICKNNEYVYVQKNCGELGENYVCEEGICTACQHGGYLQEDGSCGECLTDAHCVDEYEEGYTCFQGSCAPPPSNTLCIDSDGGIIPDQYGIVEIFNDEGESFDLIQDICGSPYYDNYLNKWVYEVYEKYCPEEYSQETFIPINSIICQHGCHDGECIKERICSSDISSIIPSYSNLNQIREKITDRCWGDILASVIGDYSIFYNESEALLSSYDVGFAEMKNILSFVNIFYLENNKIVPWSISDYTEDEIEALFLHGDELQTDNEFIDSLPNYGFNEGEVQNALTIMEFYKITPLTLSIIGDNPFEYNAINKIVTWLSKNFIHYTEGVYQPPYYSGDMNNDEISYEHIFHYRTGGCHRFSQLLVAMLKSINIPAYEIHIKGHGVTYVPTLDLFIHGDPPLSAGLLQTSEQIIFDSETFLNYAENPEYDEFWQIGDALFELNFPFSALDEKRTNDYKFYHDSLCLLSEEDVENYLDEITDLLPEYQISVEECDEEVYSAPFGGTGVYRLFTNEIPIKEFNELINELK